MPIVLAAVAAYLVISVVVGLYAARRVSSTRDYALAGRSLSLPVVAATVFATWFGAETVLGISATFLKENLHGVVADPFSASLSLIVTGIIFAAPLYRLNVLTFGEYFRSRYHRAVEITLSLCLIAGYVGWAAAQVTALGLVLEVLSRGAIPFQHGMLIGIAIIVVYTLAGGMMAVAYNDLFQALVIVAGMLYIVWVASDMAGGAGKVLEHAANAGKFAFWPAPEPRAVLAFAAAGVTLMLGSIPGQDTYQRVLSARDARTAAWGSVIGGVLYFLIALIPMYLAYSATLVNPEMVARLMGTDSQLVLPMLVMQHMPVAAQVMFFGALLCAILSTASGALLAPSVTFTENVLCALVPGMGDRSRLLATRITVACFGLIVLRFAWSSTATTYQMVETAAKVTLVSAFVPMTAGLFWRRATTMGAACAMSFGVLSWIGLELTAPDGLWPPHLAGLIASALGMLVGSLLPSRIMAPRDAA